MRYRINKYSASIWTNDLTLNVYVSQSVYDMLTIDEQYDLDAASLRKLTESVRLIADETQGGYVIMSTGQKNVLSGAKALHLGDWYILRMFFQKSALIAAADGDEDDIAAINAMQNTDQFTIEMDWGDEPSETAKETTSQEILTATQAITGYALQGSDATATNTAIAALIGYTIQEIDAV